MTGNRDSVSKRQTPMTPFPPWSWNPLSLPCPGSDFQYCWQTFVDHQGRPFPAWQGLTRRSSRQSVELWEILQVRFLPPCLLLSSFPPSAFPSPPQSLLWVS